MLTVKNVAARLGLSNSQIYALIASGKLSCHRFGNGRGALRVSEEQLAQFIEASKITPAATIPELRHIRLPGEQHPEDASSIR
jgi:excisionase family DNA binding protein